MRIHHRLTRRQLLRLSAGSLLAAGLWPGTLDAAAADQPGDFYFLVVNDIHYLNQHCGPWLERVVEQMKKRPEKFDFCLLVGDLAEDGKPEQLQPVRDIFKGLGRPVHVVVGNHDYVTKDDRQPYEKVFPKSLNYHFEHRGWQFLGLDSSYGRRSLVAMQPHSLRWLDDTLPKLDKKRPTVVFTHFPLGPRVVLRLTNAEQVLERFKEYNLQAVYNGHFHGFTERTLGPTVLTTNRCCSFSHANHDGTKEKGYFICHAKDGKVERTSVEAPA
jgi:predicted MPP superfamily phosphohydrolase